MQVTLQSSDAFQLREWPASDSETARRRPLTPKQLLISQAMDAAGWKKTQNRNVVHTGKSQPQVVAETRPSPALSTRTRTNTVLIWS
jgi:hypothetical protein